LKENEIEEIFINYYSHKEYKHYLNWKRNDGDDCTNKYSINNMTKEDFENVDIMNDREEITFYKNLFKTLKGNYKDLSENEEILIEPLFESYSMDEEKFNKKKSLRSFRKKSNNHLKTIPKYSDSNKFDLKKVNDEIIRKFGKN